jgi:ABC-type transport system involved in multi-copper enzyme maturation permease subunit
MRNVWLIWRKEMRSYFVSPIAYILLLMCALIFGFFFWSLLQAYLQFSMEAQMRGEMFPMNMPEEITRRLFGNGHDALLLPLAAERGECHFSFHL